MSKEVEIAKLVVDYIEDEIKHSGVFGTSFAVLTELQAVAKLFTETKFTIEKIGNRMEIKQQEKLLELADDAHKFVEWLVSDCLEGFESDKVLTDGEEVIRRMVDDALLEDEWIKENNLIYEAYVQAQQKA